MYLQPAFTSSAMICRSICDDMLDEVVEAFVNVQRRFPFEALGDAIGTEHRDFGRHFGDALGIAEFFERQIAHQPSVVPRRRAG